MIAGRDSSFQRPTAAMIPAIRAAGVRIWGGYLGTRGGLGLAVTWPKADFDIVRELGADPIGFCSGWEDPGAIRNLAAAWGVKACVDVEPGIRPDGPWVQGWLDESGAGLYGLASVHAGRRAAFHIMAAYPAYPPTPATWAPGVVRPAGPCGWQCQGTHAEFGISVDSGWYDDWFGEGGMSLSEIENQLVNGPGGKPVSPDTERWSVELIRASVLAGASLTDGASDDLAQNFLGVMLRRLDSKLDALASLGGVDVAALAAALAPHLPPAVDETKLAADLVAVLPGADMAALRAELAKLLGS